MSTWKKYGGLHDTKNSSRISAEYISVKDFILEKPYNGELKINGDLDVSGNTKLDVLDVKNDTALFGNNTHIGKNRSDQLLIESNTVINGDVTFKGGSATSGNIVSLESMVASRNIFLGNTICFGNRWLPPVQAIYSGINGLGINQVAPQAALDISSNQLYSINVVSSRRENKSVLAQNVSGQCIMVAVDPSNANIQFYHDNKLNSGKADAFINYYPGGFLNIDSSQNLNVSSQMTIADNNKTNVHVNNETLAVYDISSGNYYPAIYNQNMLTGSAATFVTSDLSSNTFIHINTPDKKGVSIGGGAYPVGNLYRDSGIVSLSNNTNPTQMIVAGNSAVKYFSTTGINTFQPRIDNYVLDVNGPVHIDNGDSVSAVQTPFQLYQLSMARNYPNIGIAVGSSIDFSANVATYFREKIIKTTDYGQTWSTIDLSASSVNSNFSFLNNCDFFTSVHLVDNSYCFITGNTTLLFSKDCGLSWNNIFGMSAASGTIYNNISIHPDRTVSGNLYGYMSVDTSPSMITFEYDPVVNSTILYNQQLITNTYSGIIQHIESTTNAVYLAGNAILKYDSGPGATGGHPSLVHTYQSYKYNMVKAFNNNFIVGVGNNIISSSIDAGVTWTDVSFNINGSRGVDFKGVHIIDVSNAIAAGSFGNIWITNDSGTSWNFIPKNIINASGKFNELTSNSNMYEGITMPDINTILLVNTRVPYIVGSQTGNSNIYNVFAPNYLNRANNVVLDISGTVNVSGDLKVNDNGSVITTNSLMNLFNTTVNTIRFGGDATNIIVGNSISGNTQIRTNLIVNNNVTLDSDKSLFSSAGRMDISGNVNIGGDVTTSKTVDISGNLYVRSNTNLFKNVFVNSSDIILDRGNVVVGNGSVITTNSLMNLFNTTVNTIRFGGDATNIIVGNSISGNTQIRTNLIVNNNVTLDSDKSLFSSAGRMDISGNVDIGGNVTTSKTVDISGNLYVRSNTNLFKNVFVNSSDIILDRGNVVVGNVFPIGSSLTIGGANNDIYIGGLYNTERNQNIYIGQNELGSAVNPSTIYIGGLEDNVILRGNTKILNMQKLVVRGATAFVNLPTEGFGANVTAAGAGIDIFDNSYSDLATNNVYGYMHVGKDMQSFIFKAPSYGSFSNPNNKTGPQYNTFKNIELLSNENRLGLGVNELSLKDKNIRTGLVVLQGNTDFRSYQSRYGHSYLSGADDVDHAINLLADFDVSNILLKDFIIDKQNIISEVIVGNTTSRNSIFTYGNVITYGNTILYGNTTTYKDIVTSGNIFIKSSTNSTAADNGALVVTGGVGIVGRLNIGGNIIASIDQTINGVTINNRAISNVTTLSATGAISAATANDTINGIIINNKAISNVSDLSANGVIRFNATTESTGSTLGALVVAGGVGIGGNLHVGSTASSSHKDNGALVVKGGVGISGNLHIGSNASTTSTTRGALVVTGGVGISGNLHVGSTASSSHKDNGALVVKGGVGISGNLHVGSTASTSDITSGALVVKGGAAIEGNLHIGSNASTTSTTRGALVVTGGVGINGGNLWVGSDSDSDYGLKGGALVVDGGAFITKKLYVADFTDSMNTETGALVVNGGAGIGWNTNIGGFLNVTNSTNSDSTGNGAVKISDGGLYVKKDIYVGGKVSAIGGFNSGSDYRIKKDIKPLASSKTIDLLKPVEYSMTNETYEMGFLAHEVQEIFPFLVTGEKDGEKLQTLNYNGFIALLVKEIQDLKSENKLLKSRLDAIENIIGDDNEKSRLERFRDAVHHAS